jgi:hypothetical protein
MLKKVSILLIVFGLVFPANGFAALVNYYFEGVVVANDTGQPTASIPLGTLLSYHFIIDSSILGSRTFENGAVDYPSYAPDGYTFWGDIISGRMLSGDGYYNNPSSPGYSLAREKEINYGVDFISLPDWLATGSQDSPQTLIAKHKTFTEWTAGDEFRIYEMQYFADGSHVVMTGDLTLVSVSPVPIPGAVWLLGSGLIGLIGVRRFRK